MEIAVPGGEGINPEHSKSSIVVVIVQAYAREPMQLSLKRWNGSE